MEKELTQAEKMDTSNYDSLLERALDLEEWNGIKFESLSAVYDRGDRGLTIFCEMHPSTGLKLKHSIDFIAVVYDKNDRIINRNHIYIRKEEFHSFEVIQLSFYDLTPKKLANIEKIKVYPARW